MTETITQPTTPNQTFSDLPSTLRHDWRREEIQALLALPFNELLFRAQSVHREYFDPNAVQISTLLSIKTGACPEDCKYCPQSSHYDTGLERLGLHPERREDFDDATHEAAIRETLAQARIGGRVTDAAATR